MTKDDEKKLKRHPRYEALVAAESAFAARVAAAEEAYDVEMAAARTAYQTAAPELSGVPKYLAFDARLFQALRPRGDVVRVERRRFGHDDAQRTDECEIENVTATRIMLVGERNYFGRSHGTESGYGHDRLHKDDLARIQAGELKGWRQKPWER